MPPVKPGSSQPAAHQQEQQGGFHELSKQHQRIKEILSLCYSVRLPIIPPKNKSTNKYQQINKQIFIPTNQMSHVTNNNRTIAQTM
jgi:hypothetical protein